MRSLLEIARSGIFAAQRANEVTAHNIANVNTEGYSRQRVVNEPVSYRKDMSVVGAGVDVAEVTRMRHRLLDVQIREHDQELGFLDTRRTLLQQLESSLIGDSGGDLDVKIGKFFNSFANLTTDPQDPNLRSQVASKAQTLAQTFNETSYSLGRITDDAVKRAEQTVNKVNGLLQQIAKLNPALVRSKAAGTPDAASLDTMNQKLRQLSELIGIETRRNERGAMEVRIGGMQMVRNDEARMFEMEVDLATNSLKLKLSNGTVIEPGNGRLKALEEMIEKEIPSLSNQLDKLANRLVDEVNDKHEAGYNLDNNTGVSFFDPATTGAGNIAVNQDIIDDPSKIAASDASGETGNAKTAQAIVDLRDQELVGTESFRERSIGLISEPGRKLETLETREATMTSRRELLQTQQDAVAGVNLDEELSKLVQHQNAYRASARVMQTGQELYDSLLSIV